MCVDLSESIELIFCRKHELVADFFYETFLGKYPELQRHFEHVDMGRQAVLLSQWLQAVVDYHLYNRRASGQYLAALGRRHEELGIPREMLASWKNAMMATLEHLHHDQWSVELANQWSNAMDDAMVIMGATSREASSS